jgi:hypothetical protein
VKYVWITKHRGSFPVAVMCDVLRVSTSGYYASLDREPSPRAQRHERIQQAERKTYPRVVAGFARGEIQIKGRQTVWSRVSP